MSFSQERKSRLLTRLTPLVVALGIGGAALHQQVFSDESEAQPKVTCVEQGKQQFVVDSEAVLPSKIAASVDTNNQMNPEDIEKYIHTTTSLDPSLPVVTSENSAYTADEGYRLLNDGVNDHNRAELAKDNNLTLGEFVVAPEAIVCK